MRVLLLIYYDSSFLKVKTGKREGRDPPGPMALYIYVELHARDFSFWVYI